jgi:hypothetical protein
MLGVGEDAKKRRMFLLEGASGSASKKKASLGGSFKTAPAH